MKNAFCRYFPVLLSAGPALLLFASSARAADVPIQITTPSGTFDFAASTPVVPIGKTRREGAGDHRTFSLHFDGSGGTVLPETSFSGALPTAANITTNARGSRATVAKGVYSGSSATFKVSLASCSVNAMTGQLTVTPSQTDSLGSCEIGLGGECIGYYVIARGSTPESSCIAMGGAQTSLGSAQVFSASDAPGDQVISFCLEADDGMMVPLLHQAAPPTYVLWNTDTQSCTIYSRD